MRMIVISDTHGHAQELPHILMEAGAFDVLVHLGDGARDAADVGRLFQADVVCVRGNNDYFDRDLPDSRVLTVGKEKIFCCHGHHYDVRAHRFALAEAARKAGCSVALYGHTHLCADETIGGVRCLNPGSIGYPMGRRAYIEITDGGEKAQIKIFYI